jgi:hypothetical protein
MPNPRITLICPKTKRPLAAEISTDAHTLRAAWKSQAQLPCPYCGEAHQVDVRDAVVDALLDVSTPTSHKPF